MSELNGDKARFQRLRKAGLLRRDRSRAAYAAMKLKAAAAHPSPESTQTGGARGRPETLHPEKPVVAV